LNNFGTVIIRNPGDDHQKVPVFGDIFAHKSKNGDVRIRVILLEVSSMGFRPVDIAFYFKLDINSLDFGPIVNVVMLEQISYYPRASARGCSLKSTCFWRHFCHQKQKW